MRYPFQPESLDALPEELAELFRGLEDALLVDICSRLKAADGFNEATVQDIKALRSHGISLDEIKNEINTCYRYGTIRQAPCPKDARIGQRCYGC